MSTGIIVSLDYKHNSSYLTYASILERSEAFHWYSNWEKKSILSHYEWLLTLELQNHFKQKVDHIFKNSLVATRQWNSKCAHARFGL